MVTSNAPRARTANAPTILAHVPPRWALTITVAGAFLFRLLLMRYRFAVAFDEVNYLKLGVSGYLNGLSDVLHTYWSPLLPALISFFCLFFENFELAGRLVPIVAGSLLPLPVYFLAQRVYDRKVGLVAAAFVAVFPPLAFQSTQILTEPVYMLFGALAILFGLDALQRSAFRFAVLAGLSSGLAYLAHPQAVGFFLMLVFWFVATFVVKWFPLPRRRTAVLLAGVGLAFLLMASPYLLFLKQTTGKWTFSAKASANLQMDTPDGEGGDPFRSLDPTNRFVPIDQIFHQGNFLQATDGGARPVRAVRLKPFVLKYVKNVTKVLREAIPQLLTTVPMLLLGVGLLGARWPAGRGKAVLYLLSFLAFFWLLVIPAFHINLRYFSPLWPVCAVWVGRGALLVQNWLQQEGGLQAWAGRFRLSAGGLALGLVAAGFVALSFLPELGRVVGRRADNPDYWADPVEQKQAGLWLKEHAKPPIVIMSRYHTADIYAGNYDITKSITLPRSSLERILQYAKHRGARYLMLNERYMKQYPQLRFLLKEDARYEGLRLIYRDTNQAGLVTVIYEIL